MTFSYDVMSVKSGEPQNRDATADFVDNRYVFEQRGNCAAWWNTKMPSSLIEEAAGPSRDLPDLLSAPAGVCRARHSASGFAATGAVTVSGGDFEQLGRRAASWGA